MQSQRGPFESRNPTIVAVLLENRQLHAGQWVLFLPGVQIGFARKALMWRSHGCGTECVMDVVFVEVRQLKSIASVNGEYFRLSNNWCPGPAERGLMPPLIAGGLWRVPD